MELVALRSEIDTCRESMRKQQAEIDKQKEVGMRMDSMIVWIVWIVWIVDI